MDDFLQELGNIMPHEPLIFQESLQPSTQETYNQVHHFSYPGLLALPHENPDPTTFYFGGCNLLIGSETPKPEPLWQRMKWSGEMVKLLITAVSYVGEDSFSDFVDCERRSRVKGKWRAISKCLVERGYLVSPQQCEDKFNDLNKKYKRLNDVLGSSDSRYMVENPALIESMGIGLETKEELRKILTCRQLFYKEMFSYHHRNWKYISEDESLKASLLSVLGGKMKHVSPIVVQGTPVKRQGVAFSTPSDTHSVTEPANSIGVWQKDDDSVILGCSMQLQERKWEIQNGRIELEKKRLEWLKSKHQKGRELHELRLENEVLRLENERLMLELKSREISAHLG